MTNTTPSTDKWRWARLAAGIGLFGLLMALRDEATSIWLRATIAGGAFAIMAWAIFSLAPCKARS